MSNLRYLSFNINFEIMCNLICLILHVLHYMNIRITSCVLKTFTYLTQTNGEISYVNTVVMQLRHVKSYHILLFMKNFCKQNTSAYILNQCCHLVSDGTPFQEAVIIPDILSLKMTRAFWRQNTFTFNKPAPLVAKILGAFHWKCSTPFYS